VSGIVDSKGRPIKGNGYSVRKISARLRASKEYGERGWRTIELFASADVTPGEDTAFAHNALYEELRKRISLLIGEEDRVTEILGGDA